MGANKQIGWSQESILLHGVSQQLQRLAGLISASGGGGGAVTSVTFTGNSGSASLVGGVLNIPNYTITANNGMAKDASNNITLGGPLTKTTFIDGDAGNTFVFALGGNTPIKQISIGGGNAAATNYSFVILSSTNGILKYVSSGSDAASLYLDSSGVTLSGIGGGLNARLTIGRDTLGSTVFEDNRTGVNRSGIEYLADYSVNFRALSLIHKGYADANYATLTTAQTITNKSITKRIVDGVILTGIVTPVASTTDICRINNLAENITIAAPSGTKVDGQMIMFHILSDATSRGLNFTIGAGNYFSTVEFTLPVATIPSKWMKVLFMYNILSNRWECISIINSL